MVSVTDGCILLQAFRDSLIPRAVLTSPEEAENEDIASLMQRLPSYTRPFEEFLTAAQGYLLLLMFDQYLNLSQVKYTRLLVKHWYFISVCRLIGGIRMFPGHLCLFSGNIPI